MNHYHQDRALLGIGLMLGAYFLFSFIDASAKWLGLMGLPALQLAFMRYLGHFVISSGLVGLSGGGMRQLIPAHLGLVMFRGALLMGSTVLNFFAVTYLPLTLTSTILFSAPIIICFLSWPLLGERVGIYRWSAIVLGFFGVVVAIRPFDDSFHWAVLLSLGGAVCFASGFAEPSADDEKLSLAGQASGTDLQNQALEAAGDMPFLGPNCYGFVN